MNSPGSLSKSSDPPPQSSRPHFALSESEQTEDEEGERGRGHSTFCTEDKHTPLSGQCCLTHPDDVKKDSECLCKSMHYNVSTYTAAGSSHASPGDLAFAQKCTDLQRFVRPLLELLHGLKRGRFDKGLTSFQQSVAMDRLQRILGILQKPEMGEKYLQSLLQIEVMLKMWFPRDALESTSNQAKIPKRSHHWCQNQLHMPVKKRKMTWSDHYGAVSTKHKHLKQEKRTIFQAVTSLETVSTCLPGLEKQRAHEGSTIEQSGASCTGGHEFTCITPLLQHRCKEEIQTQCVISPPSPATQDNSVSSTADSP